MNEKTTFGCLDRAAEIDIHYGNLPHWFQPGVAMFVTFRTADSMPSELIERWQRELIDWLLRQGMPPELAKQTTERERSDRSVWEKIPDPIRQEYRRLSDRIWHRALDECHGECLLRDRALARIVGDALKYYSGEKYDLDRFVIMPNHVHAIVQFERGNSLDVISQSWLRYTAREINVMTGRRGEFWQGEPFDHLIRSAEQMSYLQNYIVENPNKANLSPGEYLYWQSP